MNRTRPVPALALALALLPGCAIQASDIDTGIGVADPTWTDDVAPIVEQHCLRCHGAHGRMEDGVDLSTYRAARSARVTSVCTAVTPPVVEAFSSDLVTLGGTGSGACAGVEVFSMPLGAMAHLGLAEQVTYARWVAQGAPE
jgi:hypothetical protein